MASLPFVPWAGAVVDAGSDWPGFVGVGPLEDWLGVGERNFSSMQLIIVNYSSLLLQLCCL